jgi:hypothetical protein
MKESSDNKPQKLEDIFRQRLEEAEVSPSDRVWERISQDLDAKEAGYYKERIGWYRSLAAACIFLVMCAAGYLFYDIKNTHTAEINTVARQTATSGSAPTVSIPESSKPGRTQNPAFAKTESEPAAGRNIPTKTTTEINAQAPTSNIALAEAGNNKRLNPENSPAVKAGSVQVAVTKIKKNKLNNQVLAPAGDNILAPSVASADKLPGEIIAEAGPRSEALASVAPALISNINRAPVAMEMRMVPQLNTNTLALLSEPATETNEKNRVNRWSFNAKYASQYFNQNIQLVEQASGSNANMPAFSAPNAGIAASTSYSQALQEYDNNTTSGFSYNTAVAAGYKLNEHWSLESGLSFTQNVANTSSSFIFNNTNLAARYNYFAPQNLNNNDTKSLNDPITALPATALLASLSGQQNVNAANVVQTPTFDTQYRYRLIGIPVKVNYQTSQRKSFYFASVGFLTNMLVQAHVLSGSAKVPDLKYQGQADSPFRTWQVAATVSAGRGFRISRAVNVRAGIEGTQNLNSLAAHPEYLANGKGKPYTIGVAFSSSYTLGL